MTPALLDLHGAEFLADPHAVLRELRQRSWCAETAIGTVVLRYDEVRDLLGSRDLRTPGADLLAAQGIVEGPMVEAMRGFLLNADGEPHSRVRRLVSKAFTARRVEAFQPRARAIAVELVDELVQRDECDFTEDFATPFAMRVLGEFVGIPLGLLEQVTTWIAGVGLMFGLDVQRHRAQIEASLTNLDAVTDQVLRQRRAAPGDDLVSAMIAAEDDGDLLTDAELRSMVITLMAAGNGTTLHQLGHAMTVFMAHPEQWRLLGDHPALAASAAEEVVRYSPASLLGVPRIVKTEVELHDRRFAEGACVLPVLGSANRDPRAFADPDRFDIARARRQAPLSYGGGPHFCLGAALARLELREVLPLLADRLSEVEPAGPAEWLPPSEAIYGPARLPIRYRPRV